MSHDPDMEARVAAFVAKERQRQIVVDPEDVRIASKVSEHSERRAYGAILWLTTGLAGGHQFYFRNYVMASLHLGLFLISVLPFTGLISIPFGFHMVAILLCFGIWAQAITYLHDLNEKIRFDQD